MTAAGHGMGRRLARALGLALAVGLSGCAELMSSLETSTSTTAPPPRETARANPQITTVPPEPPASASVRRAPPPAPATDDGQQPPAIAVDPERLLGLDASALHRRLGTPSDVELEGPAEVWQYAVGDCLLRLYLYADIGTGARRTLRYDAAPVAGKNAECSPPLTTTGAADGQG